MTTNIVYLAVAVLAGTIVFKVAPSVPAGLALGTLVIAIMSVTATLTRDTAELVQVIAAVTDLVRGRTGGTPP